MLEKLKLVEARYLEMAERAAQPDFYNDPKAASQLLKEQRQLQLPVGEVSEKLGRGRHTTRHIELYSFGGGTFVADTPGFSAFDTERMELVHKEQLQYAFPEFAPYLGHCQFPDCAHRKEPGCAIRKALAEGEIGQTRYDSYERLYELASQLKEWELK